MNPVLRDYIQLAEIDHLIASTREQLDGYPRLLAQLDAAEDQCRKAIVQAKNRAEAAAKERRVAEKEIAAQRDKVRKFVSQQGAVKTNKEYTALSAEIEETRRKTDEQETIGLEKLMIEETCAAEVAKAEAELARLAAEHGAERKRIDEQIAEKKERLKRVEAERAEAVSKIDDEEALDAYESANERHPGSACVPIDGDHCSACGWQAVPHVRQATMQGELIRCEHCRRFLYAKP